MHSSGHNPNPLLAPSPTHTKPNPNPNPNQVWTHISGTQHELQEIREEGQKRRAPRPLPLPTPPRKKRRGARPGLVRAACYN